MAARRTPTRKRAAPSKAHARAKTKTLAVPEPVKRKSMNAPSLLDRQLALLMDRDDV